MREKGERHRTKKEHSFRDCVGKKFMRLRVSKGKIVRKKTVRVFFRVERSGEPAAAEAAKRLAPKRKNHPKMVLSFWRRTRV